MTAAQKAAKANFKKAIEYRKKTGVSLKEAFAHVYGKKKVGAAPKKKAAKKSAPKKAAKKVVKKAAPKKAAKKKHTKYGVVKKHVRRVAGMKKPESVHKDTKSHNVNIRVVSGMESVAIGNVKYLFEQIRKAEGQFQILKDRKKRDKKLVGFDAKLFQRYPGYIKSLKKQLTEAKKNIK
jgi:hypothetical protein